MDELCKGIYFVLGWLKKRGFAFERLKRVFEGKKNSASVMLCCVIVHSVK
jgi:hypothetical protein